MPLSQGRQGSLVSAFNKQLAEEADPPDIGLSRPSHPRPLATRASAKLEEGDFRRAVRLACSEDHVAETSPSIFAALQAKHPPPHPLSSIPDLVDVPDGPISVPPEMVSSAIRSFPHGPAGGPDGLRPQHLKDLLGAAVIEGNPSHHPLPPSLTWSWKVVPHPPFALPFLEHP